MSRPVPDHIRLLKNDKAHASRYVNREQPVPSSERAEAPATLSERAREIFNSVVAKIEAMYEVSETDVDLLVLYSNNREMLEYLEGILRVEGVTYTGATRDGCEVIKARPEVQMLAQAKALELKLLGEFGLSPNGRAKMNIKSKEKPAENPFAKFG